MLQHVIAIVGLGLLCAAWVLVQRWAGKRDPSQADEPTRRGCGGCGRHAPRSESSDTM